MSVLQDKALKTVEKYSMLFKGAKVVAGVSGGADSTALLLFLCSLRETYNLEIYAVHVHHGIRGEEADGDMAFVQQLCKQMNVHCTVKHHDIKGMAKTKNLSEEEAGRMARYTDFEEELKKHKADLIAVAHNMNDQAETVIMRLCRGTGLTGLAGIRPVRGKIIRPLIDCFRSEIEEYLKENNQSFRTDSTNFEEDYTRNRIRLRVLPYMSKEINSAASENIAKTAVILRQEDDFIESLAKEKLEKMTVSKKANSISLDSKMLCAENPVLQRRIVRMALRYIKKDIKDLALNHVESVLDIARKGGHCDLPLGLKADMSCGVLKFYFGNTEKITYSYELKPEEPIFVKECGLYFLATENNENKDEKHKYLYTKVFDCDKITYAMVVRNRIDGDKITVSSEGKTKKLKDIFIDRKIPKDERNLVPVVSSGKDVIWLVGIRDSADFVPKDKNKRKIYIKVWGKENG